MITQTRLAANQPQRPTMDADAIETARQANEACRQRMTRATLPRSPMDADEVIERLEKSNAELVAVCEQFTRYIRNGLHPELERYSHTFAFQNMQKAIARAKGQIQ